MLGQKIDSIWDRSTNAILHAALVPVAMSILFLTSSLGQEAKPTSKIVAQSPKEIEEKPLTVRSELVNFNVSVCDREGRSVPGLKKDNFSVWDNGSPADVSFFSDDDTPLSIGIVLDLSASMKGMKIVAARTALENFLLTSHPQDEYFLIAFNENSQLLLDHSLHGEDIVRSLELAETEGDTALYDAIYLGIDKVQQGVYKKKALLVITDGQENSSRYSFGDILKLKKESGVIIYAVGLLGDLFLGPRNYTQLYLDDLTRSTGGRSFYPTKGGEMEAVFEQIALELRHMYSVGYTPSNFIADGKWHKLKVKVRNVPRSSSLKIHTRSGYFAIPNALGNK